MLERVNEELERQVYCVFLEHLYNIDAFGSDMGRNYQIREADRVRWTRKIMKIFGYEGVSDYSHINHPI